MNTTTTMNKSVASRLRVARGAYSNVYGDSIDRWYLQSKHGPVTRSGRGYRTRRLAMDALQAMRSGMDWTALPMD